MLNQFAKELSASGFRFRGQPPTASTAHLRNPGRAARAPNLGPRKSPQDLFLGGEGGQKPLVAPLNNMEISEATILVVEDNEATLAFLADNLTADGYEVLDCGSLAAAEGLLRTGFPDLAIVDLGLPDGDGLDLMQRVRSTDRTAGQIDPDLPMLALSGRASELDRLRGFDRGCDDYLVKPFSYQELRARVRALLRRTRLRPKQGRLRVGSLEIDSLSRQVWVRGEPVYLSKKEFALLRALASEPTRVFTREELLRGVWGYRTMGVTRTLDSHAHRLRQKVNAAGDRYIVNVWGVGYRLVDGRLE